MARVIEVEGQPFALLVDGANGQYIVPPVVFDTDDKLIMGFEILEVIKRTKLPINVPIYRNVGPADLAWIDRTLAAISKDFGVPNLEGMAQ